jgi:hypothetical protein
MLCPCRLCGLKPGTAARESAELATARARIRDLEEEVKILRKAAAAVEAVVPPKDRYRLVAELRAEGVRIGRSCRAVVEYIAWYNGTRLHSTLGSPYLSR